MHVYRINMVHMWIAVAAVSWYNVCIVLQIDQCRYCITVFTIFIRYEHEMHENRHIVEVIYTCMHILKFICRSYRNTFHGHLLFIHINRVVAERLWWWTCRLVAVPCWGLESYRGQDFLLRSLIPCFSQLDWQGSNEIKHDIHPKY